MANTRQRFLFFSPSEKKLRYRIPGGNWWLFDPQPEINTACEMCVGLPDGSIILCDANPADPKMLHYDPVSKTWINRGHPGVVNAWKCAVDAGPSGYNDWSDEGVIDPSDGSVGSISIDGSTLALGIPDYASNDGRVDVYLRSGTNAWSLEQSIDPPQGAGADDLFGCAVAVDHTGNTLVVGEWRNSDVLPQQGAVHVFTRSSGTWSLQQTIHETDAAEDGKFGTSVAIDGNRIVVGKSMAGWGSFYTFTRTATVWSQEQKIDSPAGSSFAASVGLSGSRLVASSSDACFLYELSGTWSLSQTWPRTSSSYGVRGVAIDGDAAIWSEGYLSGSSSDYAKAHIYEYGTSWVCTATINVMPIDNSHSADIPVDIDDATGLAVVGEPGDDTMAADAGRVHVYERASGGAWIERAPLYGSHSGTSHHLGSCVSTDGACVASGDCAIVAADARVSAWHGEQTGHSAVAVSDGHVATYDGATQTWAYLANRSFSPMDVAAPSLTDIWVAGGSPGSERLERYYGGSWTSMRAQMVSNIGLDPGMCKGVCSLGSDVYLVCYTAAPTTYLVKWTYSTGLFTLVTTISSRRLTSVWAESTSSVWVAGSTTTNYYYVMVWNGSYISGYQSYSYSTSDAPVKLLIGMVTAAGVSYIMYEHYYTYGPYYRLYENATYVTGALPAITSAAQLAVQWRDEHDKEVDVPVHTLAVTHASYACALVPEPEDSEILAVAITATSGGTVLRRNKDRWRFFKKDLPRLPSGTFAGGSCEEMILAGPSGEVIVASKGTANIKQTVAQPYGSREMTVQTSDHFARLLNDSTTILYGLAIHGCNEAGAWSLERVLQNPRACGYRRITEGLGEPGPSVSWVRSMATAGSVIYATAPNYDSKVWRYDGLGSWTNIGFVKNGSYKIIAAHDDELYCIVSYNAGENVYRWDNPGWTSIGKPSDGSVWCLASIGGYLYAGTDDVIIPTVGSRVYRWDGGTTWTSVGAPGYTPPESQYPTVACLVEQSGTMFAFVSRSPGPSGVYRYNGGTSWTYCGSPANTGGHELTTVLAARAGSLYCATDDESTNPGHVYRYTGGTTWADTGALGSTDFVYCLHSCANVLYAGVDGGGTDPVLYYYNDISWTPIELPSGSPDGIYAMTTVGDHLLAGADPLVYETWLERYSASYKSTSGYAMDEDGTLAVLDAGYTDSSWYDVQDRHSRDITAEGINAKSVLMRARDWWGPMSVYVGDPTYNDGDGIVYMYSYDDVHGLWAIDRLFVNPVYGSKTGFGHSISATQGWAFSWGPFRVMIGAPYTTVGGCANAGAFHYYVCGPSTTEYKGTITATIPEVDAYLGYSQRSFSDYTGDILVASDNTHGKVHTWGRSGDVWTEWVVLETEYCKYINGGRYAGASVDRWFAGTTDYAVARYRRNGGANSWLLDFSETIATGDDRVLGVSHENHDIVSAVCTAGAAEEHLHVWRYYDTSPYEWKHHIARGLQPRPDTGTSRISSSDDYYVVLYGENNAVDGSGGHIKGYTFTDYRTMEHSFDITPTSCNPGFGDAVCVESPWDYLWIVGADTAGGAAPEMSAWEAYWKPVRGCIDIYSDYGGAHEGIIAMEPADSSMYLLRIIGLHDGKLLVAASGYDYQPIAPYWLLVYEREDGVWTRTLKQPDGTPAWVNSDPSSFYTEWSGLREYPLWRGGEWLVAVYKRDGNTPLYIVSATTWSVVYTITNTTNCAWLGADIYGDTLVTTENNATAPYDTVVRVFEYTDSWAQTAAFTITGTGSVTKRPPTLSEDGIIAVIISGSVRLYEKVDGSWVLTRIVLSTDVGVTFTRISLRGTWLAVSYTTTASTFVDLSIPHYRGFFHYDPASNEWLFKPYCQHNIGADASYTVYYMCRGHIEEDGTAYVVDDGKLDNLWRCRVLKWDGETWSKFGSIEDVFYGDEAPYSVWSLDGDVWVTGYKTVAHYDGNTWTNVASDIEYYLYWDYGIDLGFYTEYVDVYGTAKDDVYVLCCTWLYDEARGIDRYATCLVHYDGVSWSMLGEETSPPNDGYSWGEMAFNGPSDIWMYTYPNYEEDDYVIHVYHWNGSTWADVHAPGRDYYDYNRYMVSKGAYVAVRINDYQGIEETEDSGSSWRVADLPEIGSLIWSMAAYGAAVRLLTLYLPSATKVGGLAAARFPLDSGYTGVQVLPADGSEDTINGSPMTALTTPGEATTFITTEYGKWGIVMRYKP